MDRLEFHLEDVTPDDELLTWRQFGSDCVFKAWSGLVVQPQHCRPPIGLDNDGSIGGFIIGRDGAQEQQRWKRCGANEPTWQFRYRYSLQARRTTTVYHSHQPRRPGTPPP